MQILLSFFLLTFVMSIKQHKFMLKSKKKTLLFQASPVEMAKEEILLLSYQLSCVLMKSAGYQTEKVLKIFDYFSDIDSKKSKKESASIAEKRRSFLENLRNSE